MMRLTKIGSAALCALLGMTSFATAQKGFWVDEACGRTVARDGRNFSLDLGRKVLACTAEWQVADRSGLLRCKDGSRQRIRIVNRETIELNGETMRTPSQRYRVCH